MRNDPILPAIKNRISPINGEKTIGKRLGRLVTCFTVENGLNVSPKSVLVQMYATKIRKVLLLIVLRLRSGL